MSSKEDLNNTRVENNNMGLFGRGQGFFGIPKSWNIWIICIITLILIFYFVYEKQYILSMVVAGSGTFFALVERSQ